MTALGDSSALLHALRLAVGDAVLVTDPLELALAAQDALRRSRGSSASLPEPVSPMAIVRPRSVEDVCRAVQFAAQRAVALVEQDVRLVGADYLSVAPSADPGPVHRVLLGAGVVILEGLDLSNVPAGRYTLACLPLRLRGAEGAPARAILIA